MTRLAWGAVVPGSFREGVIRVSADVGCDPSHLMACMAFETGGTFDPGKRNPVSGATGLIQFMPSTARALGTTVEVLALMSREEQLEYVRRYFEPYRGRIGTLSDLYMSILWPKGIGKPDDHIIFSAGSAAYRDNAALDVNGDGGVSKAEATAFVVKRLQEGLRPENSVEMDFVQPAAPVEDRGTPARPQDIPQESPSMAPALFIPILQSLFQVFSPLAQAKISDALNKQTKDQAMSDQMAQQILEIVRSAAAAATGTAVPTPVAPVTPVPPAQPAAPGAPAAPVPLPPAANEIVQQAAEIERLRQAVAALKADQAALDRAEQDVVGYLKSLDPFLDKILEREKVEWAASEDSMDRAAARNAANPNPDDWMTKTLVIGALGLGAGLIMLVAGVAIAQVIGSPDREPSTVVWASLTGIIGTVFGIVTTIYAFRFGTNRQSAAKDFTNAAMAEELAGRAGRRVNGRLPSV